MGKNDITHKMILGLWEDFNGTKTLGGPETKWKSTMNGDLMIENMINNLDDQHGFRILRTIWPAGLAKILGVALQDSEALRLMAGHIVWDFFNWRYLPSNDEMAMNDYEWLLMAVTGFREPIYSSRMAIGHRRLLMAILNPLRYL